MSELRTQTEEYIREDGTKVRVCKTIRAATQKILTNPDIEARRSWTSFGVSGTHPGTSTLDEEQNIDLRPAHIKPKPSKQHIDLDMKPANLLKCRYCQSTEHMSYQCTDKPSDEEIARVDLQENTDKYVPRIKAQAAAGDLEEHTVRVTNIPPDIEDRELRDLFEGCGLLHRCHLVKDRITRESRGFAFITYLYRDDAQKAINTLNDHVLGHNLINVGWSKPRA
ncbi:hypothetical protein GEMRC1_005355 [Eukaryota sp. GEM-RC1]